MPRFIAIEHYTGYIWGDSADLNGKIWNGDLPDGSHDSSPIGFCRALDASLGETDCEYIEVDYHHLSANEGGYHIYRADVDGAEAVPAVTDGQDEAMIASVERDCRYVTTIRRVKGDG